MDNELNQLVQSAFSYCKRTGVLRWRIRRGSHVRPGDVAGWLGGGGYIYTEICGRKLLCHRIAWFLVTGEWPVGIDHKNGQRDDNRWSNLREATDAQNKQNKLVNGYSLRANGRYLARICINKKRIDLGLFNTPSEARSAYLKAKKRLHPFATKRTMQDLTP